MLIAMAGLPATGKSTLAARLAEALGGVVMNKDAVRAVLFPPPVLDYSTAQDDLVMAAIFEAAAYVLRARPGQAIILDGRTFLRVEQVNRLLDLGARLNETPHVIECVCADAVARRRLEHDRATARHPAANRTYRLYQEIQARAEPIALPHLALDTGRWPLQDCVDRALDYLRRERPLAERSLP
jgi:predicted kinase